MIARTLTLILALATTSLPATVCADPLRILAFGDSLTSGHGLSETEGLVPQLEAWLRARGHDVTVLNGGLAGDTTTSARARIRLSLSRHSPDAVIVELGGNDLLLGVDAKSAEKNLDSILVQAKRGGRPVLLVGMALPASESAGLEDWDEMWPRLAERHGTLLLPNLYQPFYEGPGEEYMSMLQTDGMHPSAKGVARLIETLGPRVEALIAETEARKEPEAALN